jgi:translation initiation factor 2B subunit (eIF-2B alpha/beta/delta family)
MNKKLSAIIKDDTSGSTDLLRRLAKLFSSYLESPTELQNLISEAGVHLEQFGVITSYLNEVSKAMRKNEPGILKTVVERPLLDTKIYSLILKNAEPFIEKVESVFTLSNSGTILEILKLLSSKRKKTQVFITESRPKKEGRILVRNLLEKNIAVQFGADVQMPYFIEQCDAVFLGADKLLPDGSIVNKTGSFNAAIIAGHFNKPVYIFAESSKKSSFYNEAEKNASEIWNYKHAYLTIKNVHFEVVSADLVTSIFTEKE